MNAERETLPTGKPPIENTAGTSSYACVLGTLRIKAKELGYALALHGSMVRDLDLVAVPWVDDAAQPEVLVESLRLILDGSIIPTGTKGGRWDAEAGKFVDAVVENPSRKPHGRLAWNIHLGGQPVIDLSVMPPTPAPPRDGLPQKPAGREVAFIDRFAGLMNLPEEKRKTIVELVKQETAELREKLAAMEAKLEFLSQCGLKVGMAKEAGKEQRLAYVIEPGSQFDDSERISKAIETETELATARAELVELRAYKDRTEAQKASIAAIARDILTQTGTRPTPREPVDNFAPPTESEVGKWQAWEISADVLAEGVRDILDAKGETDGN